MLSPNTTRIHTLPISVANLIAAGEVIERPAAALKELLENALDAAATDIRIDINDGGITLLRVQDNGSGIIADDLALACARHATSKIRTAEELAEISTFGFRGEALASLAAVADIKIASRTADSPHGHEYAPDKQTPHPLPMPVGTTITARALFADIPARRRFLRTPATEAAHCVAVTTQTALASYAAAFTLSVNKRQRFNLAKCGDYRERLLAVFPSLADNLLPVTDRGGNLSLYGEIFSPALGNTGKKFGQFLYVNGRYVKDRLLRRAVSDCLRPVSHDGDPGYLLFLETPNDGTDVNVHPAKLEVRFAEPRRVFDFVRRSVNKALAKPLAVPVRNNDWLPPPPLPSDNTTPPLPLTITTLKSIPTATAKTAGFQPINNYESLPAEAPLGRALGQLHDIYIIAENQNGLVIVDMHAAHERILYEELKKAADNLPMQPFLSRPQIPLSDLQAATLREHGDKLIGIQASLIDERTATLSAISIMLAGLSNVSTLLTEVLDDLANFGEGSHATAQRDFILSSIACHAAVRANQQLTLPEMNSLLRRMEESERSGFCNHGRPCWQQIDRNYFDRVFRRGQ